jgi:hypothetical protein
MVMGRAFVPQRFDAFFSPHQSTHVVFIFGHGFNFHTQLLPPFLTAAFHSLNLQLRQVALQRLVVLQNREKRVLEYTRFQHKCTLNLTSNFNMLFSNISRSWFSSKFFTKPAPCPFRSISFFFRVNNWMSAWSDPASSLAFLPTTTVALLLTQDTVSPNLPKRTKQI